VFKKKNTQEKAFLSLSLFDYHEVSFFGGSFIMNCPMNDFSKSIHFFCVRYLLVHDLWYLYRWVKKIILPYKKKNQEQYHCHPWNKKINRTHKVKPETLKKVEKLFDYIFNKFLGGNRCTDIWVNPTNSLKKKLHGPSYFPQLSLFWALKKDTCSASWT